MIRAALAPDADFAAWRDAARPLLAARIAPAEIDWLQSDQGALMEEPSPYQGGLAQPVSVPGAFVETAEDAALHCDPARFDLLYRLAHRLQRERHLMSDRTDGDVQCLHRLASGVRREVHKMHAYVRFRESDLRNGRFIAWHEPKHYVVRRAAPFFVERFASMSWSIVTPFGSAHWDGEVLVFGAGGSRQDCPAADATEDDWRVYYESIFNPARLNRAAMLRHMPRRFWSAMPETASIPRLIREAEERTSAMVHAAPTIMKKRLNRLEDAEPVHADPDDKPGSLADLRARLPDCRRCDLWRNATQPVPGEGTKSAGIMLVGEQPGDQEDLAGKPFVGPAGGVLDRALKAAGVDRTTVYITNAVKHFKFEPRGKRRLHQKPDASEARACSHWLGFERELVAPKVIVALGATALSSMKGPKATLKAYRGRLSEDGDSQFVATYHPSYILRIPDPGGKQAAFDMLVEDLSLARKALG